MSTEYFLDGKRITSLEAFYDEISRVVIPGAKWGRNLDAFNDILRGGFGTPAGGYTLRWQDSEVSKAALGYRETERWLEDMLANCHPTNRESVKERLACARQCRGPTIFDKLVEIIRGHSVGGEEHEDNVQLILE